jgi:hypothetical protein
LRLRIILKKSLFSRHFLETRLADQPEWHEDVQAVYRLYESGGAELAVVEGQRQA